MKIHPVGAELLYEDRQTQKHDATKTLYYPTDAQIYNS